MTLAPEPTRGIAPFTPRPITFLGLRGVNGWTLKTYGVTRVGEFLDEAPFADGLRLAAERLPQPAVARGRPGVGFVIFHQAEALDYLVLCWWGRENELSVRVFLRERDEVDAEAPSWREARGDESFCVWDLEILWHERNAWVETVMAPGGSVDDYLGRTMTKGAKTRASA